jgi:hypothetical protein
MNNNLENNATKPEIFFCNAPENLGDVLLENLKNYPPTYKISQTIALALLRINQWYNFQVDMEESLAAMIFDTSSRKEIIREIIVRLAKVQNENGVPLLTQIINNKSIEFPEEFRLLAFAVLVKISVVSINDDKVDLAKRFLLDENKIEKILLRAKAIGSEKIAQIRPSLLLTSLITDEYVKHVGYKVHKLKAKDTTGRWAYYFVLVMEKHQHK